MKMRGHCLFRIKRVDRVFHVGKRQVKDCEILSPCNWEEDGLIHKKLENQERSKFNRGHGNSQINNVAYLLFINYQSLSVISFCDFYSLAKRQYLSCSLLRCLCCYLYSGFAEIFFSRCNYDLFWKIGSICKSCFSQKLRRKARIFTKMML